MVIAPDWLEYVYDNGGVSAGGSTDRYTIGVCLEEGEYSTVSTDHLLVVFDESDMCISREDLDYAIEKNEAGEKWSYGREIEWEDLPEYTRNMLESRFGK